MKSSKQTIFFNILSVNKFSRLYAQIKIFCSHPKENCDNKFSKQKKNYKTSLIITFNATFNVTEEKLPNESLGK